MALLARRRSLPPGGAARALFILDKKMGSQIATVRLSYILKGVIVIAA
jgi:hypothetical protein